MNISVYLFGKFNSGYSQYPSDYSNKIFQKFSNNSKATTQVAIHRDGDLMYYGYVRKLEDGNYIGLCTVVNSCYIWNIENLFSYYENIISSMVKNGYLINFDSHGNLAASVSQLYENIEEIDLIKNQLQAAFNRLEVEGSVVRLPPVNYSVAKDTQKDFSIQDNKDDIVKSSYTNGYTFVYKSRGFNTASINSYKGVIVRKDKEITELNSTIKELEKRNSKLNAEKKRTKVVAFLAVGAFLLALLGFSLQREKEALGKELTTTTQELSNTQDNLTNTQTKLTDTQGNLNKANHNIQQMQTLIDFKNDTISLLRDSIVFEMNEKKKTENEKSVLERTNQELENKNTSLNKLVAALNKDLESSKRYTAADFVVKLYSVDDNCWDYSSSWSIWEITQSKKEKYRDYKIHIYYKGREVTTQSLKVNFKK